MNTLSGAVPSLGNGQCAHRWRGMGRCLELAITTRPIEADSATYEIPLCEAHAEHFDQSKAKG